MWYNINMTKKKTTTKKRTTKKSVKKATPYAAVKRKTGGAVLKSAKITIGEKTEIVGRIEKLVWTNEDHSWSVKMSHACEIMQRKKARLAVY